MPKTTKKKALSEEHRRFVNSYLGAAQGNGALAYRIAYNCADDTQAATEGPALLRRPEIRAALLEHVDDGPLVADRVERQVFWTRVMRGEDGVLGDGPPLMRERLKASELLGKAQRDFVERVEHSGPAGGPIETAPAHDWEKLEDDELRTVRDLMKKARRDKGE